MGRQVGNVWDGVEVCACVCDTLAFEDDISRGGSLNFKVEVQVVQR